MRKLELFASSLVNSQSSLSLAYLSELAHNSRVQILHRVRLWVKIPAAARLFKLRQWLLRNDFYNINKIGIIELLPFSLMISFILSYLSILR